MAPNKIGRPPRSTDWDPNRTARQLPPIITPQIVRLFRRGMTLEDDRSPEHIEVAVALHALLERKPWEVNLDLERDPHGGIR
jgi:hypothetical protein